MNLTQISAVLHLDRQTVRRYATAASPGELVADAPVRRAGLLDAHRSYLDQRWAEGCHRWDKLVEEIRARGYRGRPTGFGRRAEGSSQSDEQRPGVEGRCPGR